MSDEEMEKFEITDYDLDNEFNIDRRRKGLSKHQQIYGIWADDSDDNDTETQRPKNYSAPIGFISAGIQQSGKKTKTKNDDVEEIEDEKPTTSFKISTSSSELDDNDDDNKPQQIQKKLGGIAGLRATFSTNQNTTNMGGWERHTKGIGAKLLLQMGYQPGKGLGKDLQGISTPVEAFLRKGRGAIGAYGPENPPKKTEKPQTTQDSPQHSDGHENKRKKTRYYYRSVDDVIEKGKRTTTTFSTLSSELTKVKVIDMTGPQQRILSGYHALSGLKAPPGVEHYEDVIHKKCSNFTLPEIQHNLDLLVDMCEQDIIQIDRNTRNNQDRLIIMRQEENQLITTMKNEDKLLNNLQQVNEIVEKLLDPHQELSVGQIAAIFRNLQDEHPDEYQRYELGELAPGLVGPLLASALASWSPLQSPNQYIDLFKHWKDILDYGLRQQRQLQQRGTIEGNSNGIQPYDSLLWHTWMPVLRICVSDWNPRDCDPMISLIDHWLPLLPNWIVENVYDNIMIPRIRQQVNEWNPLTDTVPIHTWIHPWIPLLDEKLHTTIYPIIQSKLGVALTEWHPSDRSAKLMLKPWQRVLSDGQFVAFLLKHIVPKLQLCMQSLVINPHQQHLDAWHWVMDWRDMLSTNNMALILDKFFFPRWRQTLAVWLNHNPNYAQVTEWYTGWKNMLSDELLAQPSIKENFQNALEMMNRAVNLEQQPGAKEQISYLTSIESEMPQRQQQQQNTRVESFAEVVRTLSKIPPLYKDLVAKKCEEQGILFVPIPNKYHEAKQVYRIGTNGLQCYIDRNVVFSSQNNHDWLPTSLIRLLDMA